MMLQKQRYLNSTTYRTHQASIAAAVRALPPQQQRRRTRCIAAPSQALAGSSDGANGSSPQQTQDAVTTSTSTTTTSSTATDQQQGRAGRVRALIARHGPGAVFAYLTLSNAVSVGTLCAAWTLFVHATGQSPLAAGAWPKFLLAYAPVYCSVHIARPARLAAGLALAPAGEWVIRRLSARLGVKRGRALLVAFAVEAAVLLGAVGLTVALAGGAR